MKHPRIAGLLRRVARRLDPQPQVVIPVFIDGKEIARAISRWPGGGRL